MKACALLLGVAACGRLGFEPPGTPGDDMVVGDGPRSDGAPGDGVTQQIDAAMIDAQAAACAEAITVNVGRTGPTSTCTHPDRIDGCPMAARQEVVFRFVAPASASFTMAAYTPGTTNVSNSTSQLNVPCTATTSGCAAILGRAYTAGQEVYFVVEASAAACAMIEFSITQN